MIGDALRWTGAVPKPAGKVEASVSAKAGDDTHKAAKAISHTLARTGTRPRFAESATSDPGDRTEPLDSAAPLPNW